MEEVVPVDWSSLPKDLFYEILTWVSFKSLDSCRWIDDMAWHRITNESNFVALHSERTQTVRGYFVQGLARNVYSSTFVAFKPLQPPIPTPSLKFLPKGTRILSSSCRGILCCEGDMHKRGLPPCYYVCNPTTQQYRLLPNPKTRFHTEKVVIVASPEGILHFKIVRLSTNRKNYDFTVCEIFDSRTWRWRQLRKGLQLPSLMLKNQPGVELDNVVYWIEFLNPYIFAFDVKRETWKEIALPAWDQQGREKTWKDDKLVASCGQLLLARVINRDGIVNDEIEVWKMIDDGGGWQMIRRERERLVGLRPVESVGDFFTSQVLFLTGVGESIWMDLRKGEITRVKVDQHCPREVFKYELGLDSSSLDVRIDLML